jgi:DNA-binding MarR family transcriptional regulator
MTGPAVSMQDALHAVVAMHRLLRGLRRAGGARTVPPTQLIVLALLNQLGPLRIGELAERIPCSQPSATAAVAGLHAAGLVCRRPDPEDGRAIRVEPSEEGLRVLHTVAVREAEALVTLLDELDADQREAFLAATPALAALADRPASPAARA